ncbi:DUF4365 domain-containing protein [Ralstonia nicotianae]
MSTSPRSTKQPRKQREDRTVTQRRKQVDTNRQGQEGVAWVRWIVEGLWGCGLELISANNDDGVDAVILLKRRPPLRMYAGPTGDVIFVQIKTGYLDTEPTSNFPLRFKAAKLAAWRSRWAAYPGPAIMISVVPRRLRKGKDPVAYWSDLKADTTSARTVDFNIDRKFDADAKSDFYNLCWRWAEFRKLPTIRVEEDIPLLGKASLKDAAKDYYKQLKLQAKNDPAKFHASVTWLGWEHITRITRPSRTQQQSLLLLPVAALMLRKDTKLVPKSVSARTSTTIGGQKRDQWYEILTARVTFFARQEAIVKVVLLRTEFYVGERCTLSNSTFYSIYEVARRKKSP